MTDAYSNLKTTIAILAPETILLLAGVGIMTAGAFVKLKARTWCALAAGALAVAVLALFAVWGIAGDPYGLATANDALSRWSRLAFLFFGLIFFALAADQTEDDRGGEFFGSLLLIHAGAMIVAASNELVLMFVGLELVSIPTYLLLYLTERSARTREAATKYFFLSIFSSAILLFGMAYLYGLTGVSNLRALAYLQRLPGAPNFQLGLIAVVFVLSGLAFRAAAVPFHFYAPDVYEGSPTILAALLAWVPKGVGFIAMIRLLTATLGGDTAVADKAVLLCWVLAATSMTLGNTVALVQTNLKRLFAYSSIAHAGYLMIGAAVAFHNAPHSGPPALGNEAILFYLLAYGLMTLGVFGGFIALSTKERPIDSVDDLAGLAKTHPGMALWLSICLFSLIGVPPMAGFYGKFQIFSAALSFVDGEFRRSYQWLAVIGALNAAIAAFYYLRLIVVMYLREPVQPIETKPAIPAYAAVVACGVLSVAVGVLNTPVLKATNAAAIEAVSLPDPVAAPAPADATEQAMR